MKGSRFGVYHPWLLAVVVSSAVATAARADTTLRWKFKAGQKLGYVMTQKTAMKMDFMGNKVETSLTQTTDMTWEVTGVDKDGIAQMTQTFDRIRFEMMAPGAKIDMDTAKAEDAPGAPEMITKLFRSMAGSQFTMKVTPRGEIRDFTVPKKLTEALKEAGPAAAMFANEESLKNLGGQSLVAFPEAAIAPGKSWKGERKQPMPFGTMVMDTTYTLEGATPPTENVGIDVKVAIEPKEGNPVEIKVNSQEMKGHYRFDNSAGFLKSTDVVQKMSLGLTVNGQQIVQELESTVKMELKNDGDAKRSGSK